MFLYSFKHTSEICTRAFASVAIVALLVSAVPLTVVAQESGGEETTQEEQADTTKGNEETSGDSEDTSDGTGADGADGADGESTDTSDQSGPEETTDDGSDGTTGDDGTDGTTAGETDETDSDSDAGASDGEAEDQSDDTATEEGADGADGDADGGDEADASSDDIDSDSDGIDSSDSEGNGDSKDTEDETEADEEEAAEDTTEEDTSNPVVSESDEEEEDDNGEENDEVGDNADTEADLESSDSDLTYEPFPFLIDALINDDDAPEEEEVTGGVRERDRRNDLSITTGRATAQGQVSTDANTTNVRSEFDGSIDDLDFYTFNATGTNEGRIENEVGAYSLTGENLADSGGEANIESGDAISAFNVANVLNSAIVNSDGYMYLASKILRDKESLDLQDFFFPSEGTALEEASNCNLLSCVAEDIEYNFSQTNTATVTTDAYIEAVSGENTMRADSGTIETGNAYGAANVINVVNTNIVDSNYRLLTFNAIGDLDGDIILPTEQLFDLFFGLPNGTNQLEHPEERSVNVENSNENTISNNLDTYAESGQNTADAPDADITTGNSEAESNVLNKVNENIYGGDLMYLWIRVHGAWDGDVVGLPDGLTWEWTPDGIIIYNEGSEIEPSELLGGDIDSYTANFTNDNTVVIDNNIRIDAISGENTIDNDLHGKIKTGDAYASANVMNIANTNVVGANWTMAIVNVFGDFDGNVTFTQIDLTLTGTMDSIDDPLGPGSALDFTYTIANSSDTVATDIELRQVLDSATADGSTRLRSVAVGDLAPGKSTDVTLSGIVDEDIPSGTTTVKSVARVSAAEGDANEDDNSVVSARDAFVFASDDTDTEDDTDKDSADEKSEDGSSDTGESNNNGTTGGRGGGSSGGGGGGSSATTKSIDREETDDPDINPDRASMLRVRKESSVDDADVVKAGSAVDYTITVENRGGIAYDAIVYDTFRNPVDSVLSEQSWDLGTIRAGEEIEIEYTTSFDADTPSGTYTNTAHIEAYRNEDDKENGVDPLRLDEAVHTIEIDGVPLAIGNVGVVAYYPGSDGTLNALISWETNAPATGQIFFGPRIDGARYIPALPHAGYARESFRFETPKTKHHMILRNLTPGTEYAYKIRSTDGTDEALGGDYYFTVPRGVTTLALALPNGQVARVAGTATTRPTTPSTPSTNPTPTSYGAPATRPAPTPDPTPQPEPEPQPEQSAGEASTDGGNGDGSGGGFFSGVANKVFGLFR